MKAWLVGGSMAAALVVAGTAGGGDASAQIDPGAERPMPGEYRSTVSFISLDLPGAPPEMAQMMGQVMGRTFNYCLTPADVEEGFRALTSRSGSPEQDCSYDSFNYSAGRFDADMTCRVDGRSMRMEMSGTGSATSSDVTVKMSGDFGMGDGTMTMRAQHERIGECS